jgi:hypothetical protein
MGFAFAAFDCSGSGLSEGKYTTLGYFEKDDILPVTEYIKMEGYASTFVLWGEGMGAGAAYVSASLPGDKQIPVTALVLDAFFPKLSSAIWDGIDRMKERAKKNPKIAEKVSEIPTALVMMALSLIQSGIKSDADFDLDDINPIDYIQKGQLPIFFCAAEENPIITPDYAKVAHLNYKGPCKDIMVSKYEPGPYPRPSELLIKIRDFLCSSLMVPQDALLSTDAMAICTPIFADVKAAGLTEVALETNAYVGSRFLTTDFEMAGNDADVKGGHRYTVQPSAASAVDVSAASDPNLWSSSARVCTNPESSGAYTKPHDVDI